MKRFYYLGLLVFVFALPAAVAGVYLSGQISLGTLVPFVIGVTVFGTALDIWATRHGRRDSVWLWQFHSRQTLGIKLFDVPIEEYLFYVASSVYVIVMWENLKLVLAGSGEAAQIMGLATLWTIIVLGVLYLKRPKGDRLAK